MGLRTAHTPTGGSSEESCAMLERVTQRRRMVEEALRGVKTFYLGRLWRYQKNKSLLTTCQQPR